MKKSLLLIALFSMFTFAACDEIDAVEPQQNEIPTERMAEDEDEPSEYEPG